ncbi:MAG: HlyD family efflux transporter periplasmic adaptor subunit [Mariniblastus sp.]|nr:HlyD family efflux transporter periplasmic adaptor subunit [Mariniblastus sp.]
MKTTYLLIVAALLVSCPVTTAWGQPSDTSPRVPESVDLQSCVVVLIEDIDVPALESGQLSDVFVKEGDPVKQGQTVAQLDDRIAQRMEEESTKKYESAKLRAEDENEVKAAEARVKLATEEFSKTRELRAKGSKSDFEYKRAQYSMESSEFDLLAARTAREIAAADAQAGAIRADTAKHSVERHKVTSKIDGLVFERFREGGEWVTAGEKIMRIARIDRLRVQGHVKSSLFDPHELVNRPVTVTLQLARGRTAEFEGKITFVGIEKRGGRHSIWAEVDNRFENERWVLQPGSEVEMRIHLDEPKQETAPATASSTEKNSSR